MAPRWKDVAELLRLDTEIIEVNHHHDVRECIRGVMNEWMNDSPNKSTAYKCTWKGLCELLDDAELGRASEDLREACSYMQLWT